MLQLALGSFLFLFEPSRIVLTSAAYFTIKEIQNSVLWWQLLALAWSVFLFFLSFWSICCLNGDRKSQKINNVWVDRTNLLVMWCLVIKCTFSLCILCFFGFILLLVSSQDSLLSPSGAGNWAVHWMMVLSVIKTWQFCSRRHAGDVSSPQNKPSWGGTSSGRLIITQ